MVDDDLIHEDDTDGSAITISAMGFNAYDLPEDQVRRELSRFLAEWLPSLGAIDAGESDLLSLSTAYHADGMRNRQAEKVWLVVHDADGIAVRHSDALTHPGISRIERDEEKYGQYDGTDYDVSCVGESGQLHLVPPGGLCFRKKAFSRFVIFEPAICHEPGPRPSPCNQ